MNTIVSLILRSYIIIPNYNLMHLKTKEVMKYHSGSHANGCTMAVRYVVAYLFYPKERPN